MTDPFEAAKRALRQESLARRDGLDPLAAGRALAVHVLREFRWLPGTVVSGFWPIGNEINLRPLLHHLHEQGCCVALPVTPAKGAALTFRRWEPGVTLVTERFGTVRPTGAEVVPEVVLVPLLAFDVNGGRLGYGGGFYDRTLAALTGCFRLGCAFSAQQVDAVPMGSYDIRLDAIATEAGIIRRGG